MNKIPVMQTIADAYKFTFVGLGKVIGLIWLPVVILTIGRYFVMTDAVAGAANPTDINIQGPIVLRGLAFDLVAAVLMAVVAVAITREILKPMDRPAFLRFSLGATEFRVAGGYIGLALLFVVFVVMLVLVEVVVGAAGAAAGGAAAKPMLAGLLGVVTLAGLCALIYIFVRLSFLLVPGATMDGGFGLERSWVLTKGNFWRIFAIGLATILPISIVMFVIFAVIAGPDMLPYLHPVKGQAAQAKQMADLMGVLVKHQPMLLGVSFLLAPFTYGLTMSPPAFAYRALKEQGVQ